MARMPLLDCSPIKFKRISTRSLPSWLICACPATLWFCAQGRCSSSYRAMIWRITQGFRNFTGGKNAIVFPSASSWKAVISSRLPKRNMPHCCPCCTIFARFIRLLPLSDIKTLHRSGKPTLGIFLTGAGCNGAGCPLTGIPAHKFRVCQVCRLPANVKSVIIM